MKIFEDCVMRAFLLATALILSINVNAHAEFIIKTAQPLGVPDAPAQSVVAPTPPAAIAENQPEAPPQPPKPRFRMVFGFGKGVPLSFACRQIVPSAVKITYGPGADRTALVDWKGGDTWNRILRDAVQPLGLHLVMMTMAVEIRR